MSDNGKLVKMMTPIFCFHPFHKQLPEKFPSNTHEAPNFDGNLVSHI